MGYFRSFGSFEERHGYAVTRVYREIEKNSREIMNDFRANTKQKAVSARYQVEVDDLFRAVKAAKGKRPLKNTVKSFAEETGIRNRDELYNSVFDVVQFSARINQLSLSQCVIKDGEASYSAYNPIKVASCDFTAFGVSVPLQTLYEALSFADMGKTISVSYDGDNGSLILSQDSWKCSINQVEMHYETKIRRLQLK